MKQGKRNWFVTLVIMFLSLCFFGETCSAVQFSADMVENKNGKVTKGKIYVKGMKYLLEQMEGGQKVTVIVDRQKKVTRVIQPKEKNYLELKADDFRTISNDPFQAVKYIAGKYDTKTVLTENLAGFSCEKQESSTQGKKIMTQWVARKLSFPVKIIQHQGSKEVIIELVNIKEKSLQDSLFAVPAGYSQMEDPQLAAKRKREEMEKKEVALPVLSTVGENTVPCMVKVGAGGELRVPVDTKRWAEVYVVNTQSGESVATALPFKNGKQLESIGVSPWQLKRKGESRNKKFNDPFFANSGAFKVDEVRVKVEKGVIYATISQWDKDRKDFYNRGNLQNGKSTSPDRDLTVKITDDNPFGSETKGHFFLRFDTGIKSEKVNFAVQNKKTKTWQYPAARKIKGVDVVIGMGEGRAKISLIHPASKQVGVKETSKVSAKKEARKAPRAVKEVQEFSVKYPSGSGKSVNPGKDLVIVATGITSGAKGEILLYKDPKKKEKIGSEKFSLQKDEVKSWKYSKEKHVAKVSVWVMKGSFKVRLDQSPNAKAPKAAIIAPSIPFAKSSSKSSSGAHVETSATVAAGSALKVTWQGPNKPGDYITIVPEGVDKSQYLSYAYTSKGSPAKLQAPVKPGKYEVRYILNNPKKVLAQSPLEITQVTGRVAAPSTVKAGEKFQVSWEGPNYHSDYITIVSKGADEKQYMSYAYTSNGKQVMLQAPTKPGEYEVRYIIDQSRTAIARTPVTVK